MTVTASDRERLWERYLSTRSIEDRNAVVVANLALLHHMAAIVYRRYKAPCWMAIEDLMSDGAQALIRCVELWNPTFGVPWSTYAGRSLELRLNGAASQRLQELTALEGRIGSLSAMKDATDWEPTSREPSPGSVAASETIGSELWDIPRKWLSERQYAVLRTRYAEGLSVTETADKFGVSVQRVSQIELQALARLRERPELRRYVDPHAEPPPPARRKPLVRRLPRRSAGRVTS